ncbi:MULTISPECIES: hypothetical protein [Mycobacteroides]|jgi:hypothetical protein|uniref:PASTA domain-containing protein n=2 Tax=Mycobacteroides TaxID=670516 RepID=A0A1S1M691_MYCCH|nr:MULTISPECIES: hypothetical protein [Mycobacteroides]KRQ19188.1 hypothetical protein AOT87_26135 [Mycobacteroides sp. H003]KRQ34430.1 hypothetical protein AOT91_05890 [Mycobacteroides sp. H092]KRQ41415.1 hypothetical protein AOT92_11655 [Mycobacteroides sp. H101]KRQ43368.1 hypothetical protein AOT88_23680 [Mycobacteroides sp. H063]KRQ57999.1 hypothetical protein AOT94_13960 [Mycobacteroides sp. HXVII]
MKKITTAAALLAAAGLSLATAGAALAGPAADPDSVINDLKSNGYRVIVTKVGSDHPSQCTVQGVSQQSGVQNVQPGRNMRNQPTTVPTTGQKVAYVTLAC